MGFSRNLFFNMGFLCIEGFALCGGLFCNNSESCCKRERKGLALKCDSATQPNPQQLLSVIVL